MSKYNLASKTPEERDKVNVDMAAASVAWKERLRKPIIAEQECMKQPEHLREYFMERVAYFRQVSTRFPGVEGYPEPEVK